MKYRIGFVVEIDVADLAEGERARKYLTAALEAVDGRAEPVTMVSAGSLVAVRGRLDGEEAGPKGEEAASPPLPGLPPDSTG